MEFKPNNSDQSICLNVFLVDIYFHTEHTCENYLGIVSVLKKIILYNFADFGGNIILNTINRPG